MANHVRLGPVTLRVGSRNLAPWGYPRVQIGGLSFWSRTNSGDLHLAAYHPRRSITWLWYVGVTKRGRGYGGVFSNESLTHMARLFVTGNPYAFRVRWWHRFAQFARVRRNQWHHYIRLPFGLAVVIGRQEPMWRDETPEQSA